MSPSLSPWGLAASLPRYLQVGAKEPVWTCLRKLLREHHVHAVLSWTVCSGIQALWSSLGPRSYIQIYWSSSDSNLKGGFRASFKYTTQSFLTHLKWYRVFAFSESAGLEVKPAVMCKQTGTLVLPSNTSLLQLTNSSSTFHCIKHLSSVLHLSLQKSCSPNKRCQGASDTSFLLSLGNNPKFLEWKEKHHRFNFQYPWSKFSIHQNKGGGKKGPICK